MAVADTILMDKLQELSAAGIQGYSDLEGHATLALQMWAACVCFTRAAVYTKSNHPRVNYLVFNAGKSVDDIITIVATKIYLSMASIVPIPARKQAAYAQAMVNNTLCDMLRSSHNRTHSLDAHIDSTRCLGDVIPTPLQSDPYMIIQSEALVARLEILQDYLKILKVLDPPTYNNVVEKLKPSSARHFFNDERFLDNVNGRLRMFLQKSLIRDLEAFRARPPEFFILVCRKYLLMQPREILALVLQRPTTFNAHVAELAKEKTGIDIMEIIGGVTASTMRADQKNPKKSV